MKWWLWDVAEALNAFRPLASFRRSISFAFHLAHSFVCGTRRHIQIQKPASEKRKRKKERRKKKEEEEEEEEEEGENEKGGKEAGNYLLARRWLKATLRWLIRKFATETNAPLSSWHCVDLAAAVATVAPQPPPLSPPTRTPNRRGFPRRPAPQTAGAFPGDPHPKPPGLRPALRAPTAGASSAAPGTSPSYPGRFARSSGRFTRCARCARYCPYWLTATFILKWLS